MFHLYKNCISTPIRFQFRYVRKKNLFLCFIESVCKSAIISFLQQNGVLSNCICYSDQKNEMRAISCLTQTFSFTWAPLSHYSTLSSKVDKFWFSSDFLNLPMSTKILDSSLNEIAPPKVASVTKVLGQTKSAESMLILQRWKDKMIKKMGFEAFMEMQKQTLANGKDCHYAIERYLDGTPIQEISVPESVIKHWESVQSVLINVNSIKKAEGKIKHSCLGYYGYYDCLASYQSPKGNVATLIDWKTSSKTRYSLNDCYDDPIQVAAYAGAINSQSGEENPVLNGLIVKIYSSGKPASAFFMNQFTMEYYWGQWLQRLQKFYQMDGG